MWPAPVQEADRAGAARCAIWWIGLVSGFRSSHNIAAGADANFGTKGTLAISTVLVPLLNPKFAIDSRQRCANFGFGALARQRTLSSSSTGPSGCLICGHLRRRAAQPYIPIRFRRLPPYLLRRPAFAGASAGPEQARRNPQGEDGNSNAGCMECEK